MFISVDLIGIGIELKIEVRIKKGPRARANVELCNVVVSQAVSNFVPWGFTGYGFAITSDICHCDHPVRTFGSSSSSWLYLGGVLGCRTKSKAAVAYIQLNMGFDNECIVNIQSLAGEYFCPVCRLLVYPNEALQSQCTHLYCKPCLTYIVSTTRACPYDGYLVTEADSKPLTESNKILAETIGKVAVHCLYHRSGCTWQGSLAECISHCSGCAFGNSPVVCNRCGIQIVHRQVQEHAQNCPGVQTQVPQAETTQNPSASSAAAPSDQNQTAAQIGTTASQALTSQTVVATTTPGQDLNQPANSTSQTQPVAPTAVQPTADQWYQQQQYQQYYQQYSGYDPYQQQYQQPYPYQQSTAPQYQQQMQAYGQPQHQSQPQPQTQAQPQPQSQPQAQGHSQPISHAPVTPQSQNQTQVSQQQQLQPAVQQLQPLAQQHSQIQALGNPPAHGQAPPQSQPYPYAQTQTYPTQPQPQQHVQMPQYQQSHPQVQHSQPQVQQPVQNFPISQPQVPPHLQPHAPVQHILQPPMQTQQSNQPLTQTQPQVQNTSAHAVTGHHSYPQLQPHQNMQMGAPQRPTNMHPQGGPQPHSQHHIQQFPMMRPHQSHGIFPNQQPALFPSPAQSQNVPPSQQQQIYAHAQQPTQTNRPVMQPGQQPMLQQPFAPQQMPMPSHLRPQGSAPSFSEHAHTYPQPHANVALSHNIHPNQSLNAVGRPPLMTNHIVQSQPSLVRPPNAVASHLYGNQNMIGGNSNQVQLSSDMLSRKSEPYGKQGAVTEQKTDSSSGIPGKVVKDSDTMSVPEVDAKFEKDVQQVELGNKQKSEGPQSLQVSENGNPLNKNFVKEEAAASTWQPLSGNKSGDTVAGVQNDIVNEHSGVKDEIQDGHQLNNSPFLGELSDSQSSKLQKDDKPTPKPPMSNDNTSPTVSQTLGTSQGPGVIEYRNTTPLDQGQSGGSQHSYPVPSTDQGKHHSTAGQSFQTQSIGPPGRYNQGQAPPFYPGASNLSSVESGGRPQFGPLASGDMHGGMTPNLPPHAPEGLRDQQHPANMMVAESYPHHRPGYLNGPQGFGSQEERFKSLPIPGQQNIDRREFEDDFKRFPATYLDAEPISKFGGYPLGPPHDKGSHGFNYDSGSKSNPVAGAVTSRLFPPPYSLNEAGERPGAFHDDTLVKSDSAHRPEYLGPGPRHGRHHMDGLTPRSPADECAEMYLGRPGVHSGGLVSKSGFYDFDGRDPRRFGDSGGAAFRDNRFSHLPSHFHRGEFEGPGNLGIGEHPRSEFIGQDDFAGHFRRGDHLGPHNLPRHLPLGESLGFGAHAGHMRATELGGPQSFESFSRGNRPGHPRLGEPGFRSSFSLPGFPNDGGFLTGDIGSFDNLRRRKVTSMGWCRICKVDCESVEGLDVHSQTREHQKVAMDMVKSIKQNAKKQKLTPSEQSSIEDGSKSRNSGFEGRGNKR
ncbi:altered inheritance of mitochondria protein 3-like [Senna tora]|uniref:Altered inheritance of mitochondria protein 3-like n=1 Tax=Senna tora TaxID=362788 RepID=A0A834SL50_9FABA|nr:altered inheritance of mitochondria protein 3-like [Senna tora]